MSSGGTSPVCAALLTARSRGAIAVIRVWGFDAVGRVDAVFRPRQGPRLAWTDAGRLRVGHVGAGVGDEVIAVIIPGDPAEVELHCHGGSAALALVFESLGSVGVEQVSPEVWIRRQPSDPIATAAWEDLPWVPTLRAAGILLDQAQGALGTAIRAAIAAIPDRPEDAFRVLQELHDRAAIGLRLRRGWRVVLAGRPNVGKSELFNALAGYERVIVAPSPGTTRDVVTVQIACNGWPVELADTAGLRQAADPIEEQGIGRAWQVQDEADLVLWILDQSMPLDREELAIIGSGRPVLRVASKADLNPVWDGSAMGAITVSSRAGEGLDELLAEIARRLVQPELKPGMGVPFRPLQIHGITAALQHLAQLRYDAALEDLQAVLSGADPAPMGSELP